jgi:hypothetical protein
MGANRLRRHLFPAVRAHHDRRDLVASEAVLEDQRRSRRTGGPAVAPAQKAEEVESLSFMLEAVRRASPAESGSFAHQRRTGRPQVR